MSSSLDIVIKSDSDGKGTSITTSVQSQTLVGTGGLPLSSSVLSLVDSTASSVLLPPSVIEPEDDLYLVKEAEFQSSINTLLFNGNVEFSYRKKPEQYSFLDSLEISLLLYGIFLFEMSKTNEEISKIIFY
jgi:hypothetical protein